ncbi:MAG TPA: hypothetical protein EYP58_05835 [bacterium (Candidatus Stahlbacteria)]|nr:hypothetical protein [Candidatus Stahlbacteria bacterium]
MMRDPQSETEGSLVVEYYSGHRNKSYPVRILKGHIWQDLEVIQSAQIEDERGCRKRQFLCQVGDEIIKIEYKE